MHFVSELLFNISPGTTVVDVTLSLQIIIKINPARSYKKVYFCLLSGHILFSKDRTNSSKRGPRSVEVQYSPFSLAESNVSSAPRLVELSIKLYTPFLTNSIVLIKNKANQRSLRSQSLYYKTHLRRSIQLF